MRFYVQYGNKCLRIPGGHLVYILKWYLHTWVALCSSSRSDRHSVTRRNTGRGTMVTGSAFQHVIQIVRQWWLCGWHVRGQYALTDGNRHDLRHFCAAYVSRHESQRRGPAHLHLLIWQWPSPFVRLTPVPLSKGEQVVLATLLQ